MSEHTSHRNAHADRIRGGAPVRGRVAGSGDTGHIGLEAPDADAMEQRTSARESQQDSSRSGYLDVNEVDVADAADQDRIVELDEDDYR